MIKTAVVNKKVGGSFGLSLEAVCKLYELESDGLNIDVGKEIFGNWDELESGLMPFDAEFQYHPFWSFFLVKDGNVVSYSRSVASRLDSALVEVVQSIGMASYGVYSELGLVSVRFRDIADLELCSVDGVETFVIGGSGHGG